MAWRVDLDKFQKQQEKCQSTLATISAKTGSLKLAPNHRETPSINTNPPAPAVKFSNNTETLQHINSIRNGPVGAQIKRVIDLLLETRQALTPEKINKACYVDIGKNKAVFDSLRNNPKVRYDGRCFAYKSKHDVKDKDQLLTLISKHKDGVAVIDLKDAYPTVMEDVQALKAAGFIWLLSNYDSQEDIAYPNEPPILNVDDDLKQLFRSIELPKEMIDIEKDLQKNGMTPATNTARRRSMDQMNGMKPTKTKTKTKKRLTKRSRVTNIHLPELIYNLTGPSNS